MTNDVAGGQFEDLEIRIFPRQGEGYPVEITLGGQQEFPRGLLAASVLPWVPSADPVADGQRLLDTLLADTALRSAWDVARGQMPQRRIRLWIDRDAAELHALPWELLQQGPVMLAAQRDTPFSRYLPIELRWGGPVRERPIRVLAVISDPSDLEQRFGLPQADVAGERESLERAFAAVDPAQLQATFLDAPVTLEKLEGELRRGDYHILHYLGHGAYSERRAQAVLYMQDEERRTQLVSDDELAQMLARGGVRPRLVFLAACQTATRSTADAFVGMAPKLVSVGVPAVVAMQGRVTVESALTFGATFYGRLLAHGQVDLAANEARSTLLSAGRPDAAVPVLFMRLKSGRLWETDERLVLAQLFSKRFWAILLARLKALVRTRPMRAVQGLVAVLLIAILSGVGIDAYLNRDWRSIDGGDAVLGTPGSPCSQPVGRFAIQITEVTNADYLECVRAKVCSAPTSYWEAVADGWTYPEGREDHPVFNLTWDDAHAYCQFIGARLPTEAEWVRAARGGQTKAYPWGEPFDTDKANVFESGVRDTVEVKSYEGGRSDDGLYHLSGNVLEWVADSAIDPCDPTLGQGAHVGRGGAYLDTYENATLWSRLKGDDLIYVGVRCARDE